MVSAELVKKTKSSSELVFFSCIYHTTGLNRGFRDGGTGAWSCLWMTADLTSGLVLELWGPDDGGERGGVEVGESAVGSLEKFSLSSSI
jgi:hypothetical protein